MLPPSFRRFTRDNSFDPFSECDEEQGDEILNHVDDPPCWAPEVGVVVFSSGAHEALGKGGLLGLMGGHCSVVGALT